jgi:hypothetical protein
VENFFRILFRTILSARIRIALRVPDTLEAIEKNEK